MEALLVTIWYALLLALAAGTLIGVVVLVHIAWSLV